MMASASGFVEEIDYRELEFFEVVGRGAFGVVSRAKWKDIDVAVKLIETEAEKKAFIMELKQLSRVNHPNIVKLYGASTKHPVCLVMEYAEGGSLYNVLHGSGTQPEYTAAHAMSWSYQCACGVSYLHGMKPRALVHRDLKPPNLLLINGGTVLRICDFGTACDAQTHMTNNKGSAAWMAPEVFEGSNYSEKCDVFSWGIILWEVLTRRKPFDDIGGPAFRIMWAVHSGTRPPLIQNCPEAIEKLMTSCWSKNPCERPSMSEVERIMQHLMTFFKGADHPLVYPHTDQVEGGASDSDSQPGTQPMTAWNIQETMRQALKGTHMPGELITIAPSSSVVKMMVVEDTDRRTSAPASLAASMESLNDSSRVNDPVNKRFSADLSQLEEHNILQHGTPPSRPPAVRGHRRTGSHGSSFLSSTPSWAPPPGHGHRRTGSFGNAPLPTYDPPPPTPTPDLVLSASVANKPSFEWNPAGFQPGGQGPASSLYGTGVSGVNRGIIVDHELQPLAPCSSSPESMAIFEQHVRYTEEYIRIKTEIALLTQEKEHFMTLLEEDKLEKESSMKAIKEYTELVSENEQLSLLQRNLKVQLEQLRKNRRPAQLSA